MTAVQNLITENLDIWTSAIKAKSASGRGSSSKIELTGIKKLRELILELAIRGKLVPQDPNDEPASELLKNIRAEKTKLIQQGKIKKTKPLPDVTEEEKSFTLPQGWEVSRIGNLVSKLGSGSTPRGGKNVYVDIGIPFLRSQNVWNDGLKLDDIAYIPKDVHSSMEATKVFPGDILLNITGASLGRSTIFPDSLGEANVSQHVTIIRLLHPEMTKFLHLGILSPLIQKLVWGRQVGMAIEGLSKKVLELFEFPIPPLAEQHRIVAKVDELMALCDQLEQQTEQSLQAHPTLVEVLLNTLTNSDNAQDFAHNWQRIAEHFDTLFTTEHSIDQLKQTLLQLAVMGKLVPQDPNDEPASELLKKIAAEKAKLIRQGKIKKQKPLPPITDEEMPFGLPNGWEWSCMEELSQIGPKNIVNGDIDASFIPMPLISTSYDGSHDQEVKKWSEIQKGYTHFADGDIAIAKITPCFENSKTAIFNNLKNGIGAGTTELHVARPIGNTINRNFILLYLKAPQFLKVGETKMTGSAGQKRVPREFFALNPLPLPPVEEQHRIVTKIDKLMALCDQLKEQLQLHQTTKVNLAETLVKQGLN